jgi:hypothetical protein
MASQTQGAANGFGTYGGTAGSRTPVSFTVYNASNTSLGAGFVMPTVDGFTLTHNYETSNTRLGNGDYDSHTVHGEYLEMSCDLVFVGSSEANLALAERGFPPGSTIVISGAPVRSMGSFTDAINVAGGSAPETSRWHPMPGMTIRRTSTGTSTGSITLRRYPGIVGGAAIVV